jgi:rubrerythrin
MALEDKKEVAKFLYCSSILERRVADAFNNLANRTENPEAKSLLLYIAYDSTKHSLILKQLGQSLARLEVTTNECERIWGKTWTSAVTQSMEKLAKKTKLTSDEIALLVDGMKKLEGLFAEEYLSTLHSKTVGFLTRQRKEDMNSLNRILDWIVEDERRHMAAITMISETVSKNRQP